MRSQKRRRRGHVGESSVIELTERDLDIIEHILRNHGHVAGTILAKSFWGSEHSDPAVKRLRKLLDARLLSVVLVGSRKPNEYFVTNHGFRILLDRRSHLQDLRPPKPARIKLACLKSPMREETPIMSQPEELIETETVTSLFTTRCHPDHAKVLLKVIDGTFKGDLTKAMSIPFVKALQRREFLVHWDENGSVEWTVNTTVAQTFRFQPKDNKHTMSLVIDMQGPEERRRVPRDQWRLDLEAIANGTYKEPPPALPMVSPTSEPTPDVSDTRLLTDSELIENPDRTTDLSTLTDKQLVERLTSLSTKIGDMRLEIERMEFSIQEILGEQKAREQRRTELWEQLNRTREFERTIIAQLKALGIDPGDN